MAVDSENDKILHLLHKLKIQMLQKIYNNVVITVALILHFDVIFN